jgi:hypothetical protein
MYYGVSLLVDLLLTKTYLGEKNNENGTAEAVENIMRKK